MKHTRIEHRRSQPHRAWESLPILGEDRARRAFRARVWRVLLVCLCLLWAGVAIAIGQAA